ncbi:MAG: hypothetical protein WCW84_07975 [Sulfurimonas sp.]|jgi:hypothetical protein
MFTIDATTSYTSTSTVRTTQRPSHKESIENINSFGGMIRFATISMVLTSALYIAYKTYALGMSVIG